LYLIIKVCNELCHHESEYDGVVAFDVAMWNPLKVLYKKIVFLSRSQLKTNYCINYCYPNEKNALGEKLSTVHLRIHVHVQITVPGSYRGNFSRKKKSVLFSLVLFLQI
jgi:hypothetical protein